MACNLVKGITVFKPVKISSPIVLRIKRHDLHNRLSFTEIYNLNGDAETHEEVTEIGRYIDDVQRHLGELGKRIEFIN